MELRLYLPLYSQSLGQDTIHQLVHLFCYKAEQALCTAKQEQGDCLVY